jgi:alpha-glucosidase
MRADPAAAIAVALDEPHHDGSDLYVDRLGDVAELRLRAPDGAADVVLLRYVQDGEPRTVRASIEERSDGEAWWRAELPLRNPLTGYRWLLTGGTLGYRWLNGTGGHAHEVPPTDDFVLSAKPEGPDWHLESVVYEIFIDRFARSGREHPVPAWAVRREWGRPPDTESRNLHRELYCGDLGGIEQHLDHLESLGANVIYLTPFFPGESNHRYDPSSFDHVDPAFGGDEALASLCRSAHARGVKVVGDLSLDHSGSRHDWFQRAQSDESSAERSFYLFDRSETHGYVGWLGYREMPRFDWRSTGLRARVCEVVERWLEQGLDGWRIGAAPMIGRHEGVDVNAEVARLVRESADGALLVAEYWHDFRPDLDGRGWHGVMNYAGFLRPVWWWLRDHDAPHEMFDIFSATPAPSYGGADAAMAMQATRAGVPWETTLQSWLVLDTHDTPRFGVVAGSRERQLVGIGVQMTMPGVPMVFAGAELGLPGASGYDTRRTMPWDEPETWDTELLDEYRRLIALRRSHQALARGGLRMLYAGDDVLLYLRETRSERLLCLASRASHAPVAAPFAELETLYGEDVHAGVLPCDGPAFHVWRVTR